MILDETHPSNPWLAQSVHHCISRRVWQDAVVEQNLLELWSLLDPLTWAMVMVVYRSHYASHYIPATNRPRRVVRENFGNLQ